STYVTTPYGQAMHTVRSWGLARRHYPCTFAHPGTKSRRIRMDWLECNASRTHASEHIMMMPANHFAEIRLRALQHHPGDIRDSFARLQPTRQPPWRDRRHGGRHRRWRRDRAASHQPGTVLSGHAGA